MSLSENYNKEPYPKWLLEDCYWLIQDLELKPEVDDKYLKDRVINLRQEANWMFEEANHKEYDADILEFISEHGGIRKFNHWNEDVNNLDEIEEKIYF